MMPVARRAAIGRAVVHPDGVAVGVVPPRTLAGGQRQLVAAPVAKVGRVRDPHVGPAIILRAVHQREALPDAARQQGGMFRAAPRGTAPPKRTRSHAANGREIASGAATSPRSARRHA